MREANALGEAPDHLLARKDIVMIDDTRLFLPRTALPHASSMSRARGWGGLLIMIPFPPGRGSVRVTFSEVGGVIPALKGWGRGVNQCCVW